MSAKRDAPLDFAEKYLEFNGSETKLKHHYTAGKTAVKRWIAEVIDDGEGPQERVIELADLPKGRPAEMVEERGMDPAEWRVSDLTVNEWEMGGDLNRQTKLRLTPIKDTLRPARTEGYRPPKPAKRRAGGHEGLWVITGDEQEPFGDPACHKGLINWLGEVQPDYGVNLGDFMDWPSVSKYRKRPVWDATVNECIDATWRNLADRRTASPNTRWRLMQGNHEERLNNYILEKAGAAHGLKRAGSDEEILTPEYLLRLDELGVEYVADYPHGRIQVTPTLAIRHGWIVKKGAGASALETLRQTNYSVIIGHVHRQGITALTVDAIDGEPAERWAAEAGCMCIVKGGLGHTAAPDWQQGFLTVQVFKDGSFHIEPATFSNGYLHWRGDRW